MLEKDHEMKTPMSIEIDAGSVIQNQFKSSEKITAETSPLSGAGMMHHTNNFSPNNCIGLQFGILPDQTPPDTPIFKEEKDKSLGITTILEINEDAEYFRSKTEEQVPSQSDF